MIISSLLITFPLFSNKSCNIFNSFFVKFNSTPSLSALYVSKNIVIPLWVRILGLEFWDFLVLAFILAKSSANSNGFVK